MKKSIFRDLQFCVNGKIIRENIEFKPYKSVVVKISSDGSIEKLDVEFVPKDPKVVPREKQRMHF